LCGTKKEEVTTLNSDYLRVHITANSNSNKDENIKYLVKDAVVEFLIPKLADAQTKQDATAIVLENLEQIEEVSNAVLKSEGATYLATATILEEEIPARDYDNLVLESGIYECLKIDLGQAKGDNWWCVVFPAVCFLSSKNFDNYVYISKIWDIICSVTNQT
jgi:stage II sporulation protein R